MYALLILSLLFAPLAFAAVEPWAYVPLYAVFFLGAAALYAKGDNTHPNPLYKGLLPAVLGVAAIGLLQLTTQAPVNGPSHLLFTTGRLNTANAALLWLWYAAVMYCASKAIKTTAQLSGLLWTLFGLGVFVSLMGMLQKTGVDTIVYGLRQVKGQPFGPFVNRDHGAFFLALAGMAGLGLFFGGLKPLFRHQSHTRMFDLLAVQFLKLVMLTAVIAGIVKTGSRGGLHSFFSAALFMGAVAGGFLKSKTQKIAAWLALLLLLAGYGLLMNKYRILLGLDGDKLVGSVTVRFSMYKSGLEMFKDFPVLGTGLGAVEHAFPYYARPDLAPVGEKIVKHVHSDWIELFLQVGLVGGLLYLAGLGLVLLRYYKAWVRCKSFTVKAVYGGALGAAIVGMLHSFVDFGLQMPANALAFYALLGALASRPAVQNRTHHDEEEDPEPVPPKKLYANAAAVAALVLTAAAVPQMAAWFYEQQAKDADFDKKVQVRGLALKLQPGPQQAFRLAADYYNHALKDKAAPCALFKQANDITAPYLRQAPANAGLNLLSANLRLQLANCYNRPLVIKGAPKPPAPVSPTSNASRP